MRPFRVTTLTPWSGVGIPANGVVVGPQDTIDVTPFNVSWTANESVEIAIVQGGTTTVVGTGMTGNVRVTLPAGPAQWKITAGANGAQNVNVSAADADPTLADVGAITFDVKTYGAVGDGVTDDTAAIIAADTAASGLKGVVFYPPGTYRVSSPITPSSGVSHVGSSMWGSIITVLPADFSNFSYSYIFQCTNSDVTISDIGLDGQKRNGTNPANECGGISIGPNTFLNNVRIDDPNYFGIWVGSTAAEARVVDCRSARGGNNDCIGGGGGNDVQIVRHVWESTLAGNRFDNVNGSNVILVDCVDVSDTAINPGGIYFEGMVRSGAIRCRLLGGSGINLQSDAGYAPATTTNPLLCFALDNYIDGAQVSVLYDETATSVNKGGYNRVSGNVIENSLLWGILLINGSSSTYSYAQDIISDNTIRNPNVNNATTSNTGIDVVYVGAITADRGGLTMFTGNITIDERSPVQTQMPISTTYGGTYYMFNNRFGPSVFSIDSQSGAVIVTSKNAGYNPVGLVTIAVPATGVAVPAATYDATFYITASTSTVACAVTDSAGTSQTVATIPASGFGTVFVPAGSTLTPTYTVAPTWTVQGN